MKPLFALPRWWGSGRQYCLFTLYYKDDMDDLSLRER